MKIFKSNHLKYFPSFFLPRFMPKIIDDININDNLIGRIAGINFKKINFNLEKEVDKYIQYIKGLKTQEDQFIYIEGQENLSKEIKLKIAEKLDLDFKYGDNIRTLNISTIIRRAFNIMRENHNSKEVLIICKDKEKISFTLKDLAEDFKFVSVFGLSEGEQHELYEQIFDDTGISIFQPTNIERLLKIYNVIVNFYDTIDFNILNLRNDVIVIDFSNNKPFKEIDKGIIIEDINFRVNLKSNILSAFVNPELFETIFGDVYIGFSQIKVKNSLYYLEDIIEKRIRLKGKF